MGIKDLWGILSPFCERKPLFELQGKTVAVDLSCWICEAQNIAEYQIQPRMYLRNLYFRTCYLLLMDVTPVFVLEGTAPSLKHQTIADRNAIQFKGAKPKSDKVTTGKGRTRFNFVLKQCEEMLKYMGLACITGTGEAESMCAYLNEDGLVAGCISQDSDCFAYGAQIVYKNFSISHQGSSAASGGAVDIYDIKKANQSLNFGRNKIITLALLCGSDYNDGVHGVGKDSALKFMNKYSDKDVLDRIRSWRSNKSLFDELEKKINDKNICTACGHPGKIQSHTKIGCRDCKTAKGCDFTKFREERLDIKNELQIRNKALVDPEFPNEGLINEFLIKKDNVKQLDLKWRQPDLIKFVKFTVKFLQWEEIYAFEKLLPVLSRWHLKNYKFVSDKIKRNSISEIKGTIQPKCIKKARNPKGIPSFEIIWEDPKKCFDCLIPFEQIEVYKETHKDESETLWSTVEPKELVEDAYPCLVENFLESKNKKAKKPTKRQKAKKNLDIDNLSTQLLNTSISEPKPKKSRKKTTKVAEKIDDKPLDPPVKTIDNFFPKLKQIEQLKAVEKFNFSFDLNASGFGDENDDVDISFIVEELVQKVPKLPANVEKLGYKVVFNSSDNCEKENSLDLLKYAPQNELFYNSFVEDLNYSLEKKSHQISPELAENAISDHSDTSDNNCHLENDTDRIMSSFFEINSEENADLFEKTFDKNFLLDVSSDTTVEFDIGDLDALGEHIDKEEILEAKEESADLFEKSFEFTQTYVPLLERINRKMNQY